MADFKVIETQEDFDKAIQKRLEQKDRELAEKYKGWLSPEDVDALKAEHDKALAGVTDKLKAAEEKAGAHTEEVQALTQRAARAESALLKSQIAHEKGVPIELADRLVGENADELKADAEKIASYLAPKSAPPLRTTEPAQAYLLAGNTEPGSKQAADAAMMAFLPQLVPTNS